MTLAYSRLRNIERQKRRWHRKNRGESKRLQKIREMIEEQARKVKGR